MGEEEEALKAILREAFGDSSSESEGESSCDRRRRVRVKDSIDQVGRALSIFGDTHVWEPITEINGLSICRDFLSADEQSSFLFALERGESMIKHICFKFYGRIYALVIRDVEGYLTEVSHNQAMRFGDLPPWALELSEAIRENVVLCESTGEQCKEGCLFPPELLWREPLFNQFIVNIYQPGEGICAHVDLMRFEDGIAIISLESSCVMHFTPLNGSSSVRVPVLLSPGSVILMWGEARYQWKHEINRKPGNQIWDGKEMEKRRRTSVTLRRLCLSQTDQ